MSSVSVFPGKESYASNGNDEVFKNGLPSPTDDDVFVKNSSGSYFSISFKLLCLMVCLTNYHIATTGNCFNCLLSPNCRPQMVRILDNEGGNSLNGIHVYFSNYLTPLTDLCVLSFYRGEQLRNVSSNEILSISEFK